MHVNDFYVSLITVGPTNISNGSNTNDGEEYQMTGCKFRLKIIQAASLYIYILKRAGSSQTMWGERVGQGYYCWRRQLS